MRIKKSLLGLIVVCCFACTSNKKSENLNKQDVFLDSVKGCDKLDYESFYKYMELMDSLSLRADTIRKDVFFGLDFGASSKEVAQQLFANVEKGILDYDTENWFLKYRYKNSNLKFIIECDYEADRLYRISIGAVATEEADALSKYDLKMALNEYFKSELKNAKRLQREGHEYNNAISYKENIQYQLDDRAFHIEDLTLTDELITKQIDTSQAIADMVFGSE